ncbi:hypothetical protein [Novosphingobium aquimarinum]|uniref:hypothetical protein n=1 Tax=Novosphingobium aquimarinum TaxID=2682494 RepID=UPI0012EB1FF2|nr:hypothetical protein [Novosphingobium aquimarinum]
MPALSLPSVIMFIGSALLQLAGVSFLPASRGFTAPLPTLASALCFLGGVFLLARIIASGVNIGTLIPLSAAFVPLCAIAFGVMVYGEPISWAKAAMLILACALVALASAT